MATWANLSLQDKASPFMEQLTFFLDHAVLNLIMISTLFSYLMSKLFFNMNTNRNLLQGQTIEIICTILAAVTLIYIAFPSLRFLYLLDEVSSPSLTVKTFGHQWYWSYECSDFNQLEFDSYMTPYHEMNMNGFRLLDVDNRTVLPKSTKIRMLVTAADVLHSWTVTALGVKVDGTPGWLKQTSFMINRPGDIMDNAQKFVGLTTDLYLFLLKEFPLTPMSTESLL